MYLLDRLLFYTVSFLLAVALTLPFLRWWKKHLRLQGILIVFFALTLTQFGPDILFLKSIPNHEEWIRSHTVQVDMFSFWGTHFSISSEEVVNAETATEWTKGYLTAYEPWLIGYYESQNESGSFSYLYNDDQGERTLIFFLWYELDDGSILYVVVHNLVDPLDSLMIEGNEIDLVILADADFAWFVLSGDESLNYLRDSVIYNGIEIGNVTE